MEIRLITLAQANRDGDRQFIKIVAETNPETVQKILDESPSRRGHYEIEKSVGLCAVTIPLFYADYSGFGTILTEIMRSEG
jgi:hypothetical protein